MDAFAQLLSSMQAAPPAVPPQPPRHFQIRAKNVALTYPQCDLDKQFLFDWLVTRCGDDLAGILVAVERHADGNTHFHAYLRFQSSFSTRDSRYFDVDGHHPNVQACRSPGNWIRYCLKEDPEPLSQGMDLQSYRGQPRERLTDIIARRLESGDTLGQISQSNPGFLLLHMRKALDYKSFLALESIRRSKANWGNVSHLLHGDDDNRPLAEWLNGNLFTERPLRKKQLWLHSPPGAGKTTLVMNLEKYLMVYWVPQDMDFYEGLNDQYDLIVFDEMKSQKKLTWLNQFIVGQPMIVNVKGTSIYKTRNVPVIFMSNSHPEVCYPKDTPQRQAFLDRLEIIEVPRVRIEIVEGDRAVNLNE